MNIDIRKYEDKDWESICSIFDRAKPDEMRGSCDLNAIKPLKEDEGFLKSFKDSEIFIADFNGKVVGFAGYCGALISWLIVDPDFYKRGIGKRLVEVVIGCIGEKAHLLVAKFNEPAKSLYYKLGFKVVDDFTGEYNGYEAKALRLAINPELKTWVST